MLYHVTGCCAVLQAEISCMVLQFVSEDITQFEDRGGMRGNTIASMLPYSVHSQDAHLIICLASTSTTFETLCMCDMNDGRVLICR